MGRYNLYTLLNSFRMACPFTYLPFLLSSRDDYISYLILCTERRTYISMAGWK